MAYICNTSTTQAFTPAVDYFNGNGSSVAFTLSRPVASVAQVQVVIENVPQNPSSAYTVSGNTITFTSAPPSGTSNIYVEYTSPITQVIAPGQGTVSTAQLGNINNINSLTSLALQTNNGVTALSIDASGNVGIGTISPTAKLQVIGTMQSSVGSTTVQMFADGGSNYIQAVGAYPLELKTTGSSPLVLHTNNAERMRIDSSGNLLVGTTSAQGILTIKQSSNGYTGCLNIVDSVSTNKWALLLDSGTTNFYFGYNGASKSYISSSTGAFAAVSDMRAKKDIVDSKYGLAEILQLRSVEYLMLEEDVTAKKHIGLIAQEVKAVIDEAVDDAIDEETLIGLDKSGLVPVLIKAIQELKAIIDTQNARIEALEAK